MQSPHSNGFHWGARLLIISVDNVFHRAEKREVPRVHIGIHFRNVRHMRNFKPLREGLQIEVGLERLAVRQSNFSGMKSPVNEKALASVVRKQGVRRISARKHAFPKASIKRLPNDRPLGFKLELAHGIRMADGESFQSRNALDLLPIVHVAKALDGGRRREWDEVHSKRFSFWRCPLVE